MAPDATSRVMKARHQSSCARCARLILRGNRIGYVEGYGWVHCKPSCSAVAERFGAFTATVLAGSAR